MKKNAKYYANTTISKKEPISIQIEMLAAGSDYTLDHFSCALWEFLSSCKDATDKLARELNVYPYLPNVHHEMKARLTAGVNVEGCEPNSLY